MSSLTLNEIVLEEVMYNQTQVWALNQEWFGIAVRFGGIALAIGGAVGFVFGYYYYKNRYGSSE